MVVVYNMLLFLCVVILTCSFVLMEFSTTKNPEFNSEFPEKVKVIVEMDAFNLDDYFRFLSTNFEHPPEICPAGIGCGFQIYDTKTRKPNQPFIKYCTCPEGATCVKAGESKQQSFFYYKCKVLEGTENVEDIADLSRTREFKLDMFRTEVAKPTEVETTKTVTCDSAPDFLDVFMPKWIAEIAESHDEVHRDALIMSKIQEYLDPVPEEVVRAIVDLIKLHIKSRSKADSREEL